jgi:hypothetical protein
LVRDRDEMSHLNDVTSGALVPGLPAPSVIATISIAFTKFPIASLDTQCFLSLRCQPII